jgi:hypothetical protein
MTRSLLLSVLLALTALWPPLVATSQEVRNTSTTNSSGERVLRIESAVPASPKEVWKAFTTVDGLETWIAPVVSIDLRIAGILSTHYDKTAAIGSPGTIQLGIVNYLEGELMTLKVKLTKRFGEKVFAEDQNLQEIIQLIPLTNGTTKVISSMVGWGTGKEWDDAYDFFAKGNEWTYQQLVKSFSSKRESHQALLSLPYRQFDQTPAGWRPLADQREYREAAVLIEAYFPRHPELLPNDRAMLHFHAAQLFGFEGDREAALRHLKTAGVPDDSTGFPTRWNDYVAATTAFLKHDRTELIAARERMASALSTDQDRTYLGVVDLLISRWGDSYGTAYLSQMDKHK